VRTSCSVVMLALALVFLPGIATSSNSSAGDPVRTDQSMTLRPAATMDEIRVVSHGTSMNGLIYLPAGSGPHPIVIFLHGYPGNERNLDIAQAVRRAGYAALYFDYRGAFGSGGSFTFANSLEDVESMLAWIRTPQVAAKYHVDPARIAVFGHSFGGWLALASVARESPAVCVAAAAAWNPGWVARRFAGHADELSDVLGYYRATTDPTSGPIRASADDLIREMRDRAQQWDYVSLAGALKGHALLLVAGTNDTPDEGVERESELVRAIRGAGGKQVQMVSFEDDESFSSHRLALADAVVHWLRTGCAGTQRG
jgi:dipeptidyl aminopeptidase/acylaminoacyl peptidase